MNQRLIDALEMSINSMEAGIPLEDCLKRYPNFAPELRELLKTVKIVDNIRVDGASQEQMDRNRIKILVQAKSLISTEKRNTRYLSFNWLLKPLRQMTQSLHSLRPFASRLFVALGITGILILFSGGLLITSAKSLPGDSLYPVKRAFEDIKVYLAPSGEIRHVYEESYDQQRVDEVIKLLGLARNQRISFEGIIISLSDSWWNVSGIQVNIQSDTTIVGGYNDVKIIEPGTKVEVEGITSAKGWVIATEIHIREYKIFGSVDEIGTDHWKISGTRLLISSNTQIDSGIEVGDEVTVLIQSEDSGLFALAILRNVHLSATPTVFQSPTAFPTASMTPTEEITSETSEEGQLTGTLDNIGPNYWVVSGQVVYIVGETHMGEGIILGDSIKVKYKIEANGSYTAIEIEKIENNENHGDDDGKEAP